jgi:hypothetical protein
MGLSGKHALRMSASSTHRTLAPGRFEPTQRYDSKAAGGFICRIYSGSTKSTEAMFPCRFQEVLGHPVAIEEQEIFNWEVGGAQPKVPCGH